MEELYQDNLGQQIGVGDWVAYNYSGQIGAGRVVNIKTGIHYGKPYVTFVVERYVPKPKPWEKKTSQVLNSKNLLLLASAADKGIGVLSALMASSCAVSASSDSQQQNSQATEES